MCGRQLSAGTRAFKSGGRASGGAAATLALLPACCHQHALHSLSKCPEVNAVAHPAGGNSSSSSSKGTSSSSRHESQQQSLTHLANSTSRLPDGPVHRMPTPKHSSCCDIDNETTCFAAAPRCEPPTRV
jgi:hypothetical protein